MDVHHLHSQGMAKGTIEATMRPLMRMTENEGVLYAWTLVDRWGDVVRTGIGYSFRAHVDDPGAYFLRLELFDPEGRRIHEDVRAANVGWFGRVGDADCPSVSSEALGTVCGPVSFYVPEENSRFRLTVGTGSLTESVEDLRQGGIVEVFDAQGALVAEVEPIVKVEVCCYHDLWMNGIDDWAPGEWSAQWRPDRAVQGWMDAAMVFDVDGQRIEWPEFP